MPVYLLNAFSFNMISKDDLKSGVTVETEMVESLPDGLTSAVGHADPARILGVEPNRVSVSLRKGDVAYVAQYYGARLPEGATELPEGAEFVFLKVTVK